MGNFELIDDYLTNRLNEPDRNAFEQQMSLDPYLKADVELQKGIIEGLKSARVAELKSMLNKVQVAAPTFYLSPLRIAAGLMGAAVLATGLYFYLAKDLNFNPSQLSSSFADSIKQTENHNSEILVDSIVTQNNNEIIQKPENNNIEIINENEDKPKNPSQKESKPVIDLMDPTEDLTDDETVIDVERKGIANTSISVAKIEVDINSSERKLKSHYQFVNDRLILFGNFDSGLYEIIEVNSQNSKSLFLFYSDAYYLLDASKKEVTPLKVISDPVLTQKLRSFRSN